MVARSKAIEDNPFDSAVILRSCQIVTLPVQPASGQFVWKLVDDPSVLVTALSGEIFAGAMSLKPSTRWLTAAIH